MFVGFTEEEKGPVTSNMDATGKRKPVTGPECKLNAAAHPNIAKIIFQTESTQGL